ncbi:Ribosomal protein S16, mitochondrial [Smittium culicis]|uniref:Ribosomal protein S16, mitochondrial n=1 Tax=Smittium culicis TaxID=133412 RepID=A0A1R1XU78_9FUNG|nr:Ribosomal protein S16, mitochondrial [Smittium culicis]
MVVKIRLVKQGAKSAPFFHIVVANARTRLTSKPLEKIGAFSPIPTSKNNSGLAALKLTEKHVQLNFDRAKYWLGVGAQPTVRVHQLMAKAGLLPPPLHK